VDDSARAVFDAALNAPLVGPVGMFRPPWADPGFILATTFIQVKRVPIVVSPTIRVVNPDPKRIALTLTTPQTLPGTNFIYPDLSDASLPFLFLAAGGTLVLTLFQQGPIVNQGWQVSGGGVYTLGVWEWLIL
jgi:hypothetical protein